MKTSRVAHWTQGDLLRGFQVAGAAGHLVGRKVGPHHDYNEERKKLETQNEVRDALYIYIYMNVVGDGYYWIFSNGL